MRQTQTAPGWLILPGDLPLITAASLQAVAQALRRAGAVVPSYQGRRGHPVGFSADCRDALLQLCGREGARDVLQAMQHRGELLQLELDDVGSVMDVDTLEQLAQAETLLQQRLAGAG